MKEVAFGLNTPLGLKIYLSIKLLRWPLLLNLAYMAGPNPVDIDEPGLIIGGGD